LLPPLVPCAGQGVPGVEALLAILGAVHAATLTAV
jgi:hypothetical protein